MSGKITGMNEMLRDLEMRFGKKEMERRAVNALVPGAEIVYDNMKQAMHKFKDTGASINEMKISTVQTKQGKLIVRIYWQGPMDRYRLIHLNEHGYRRNGKQYYPRGLGAIDKAVRYSRKPYFDAVKRGLNK
ncbi:hypothetical protein [Salinicoccus roseus]|uniref:hypothetical protein n=1 Tax=Salinicoccus roseus TaxID=45670 RepID=UPI00230021E2|nr:hypothetical protein [Salinicoccus roseus]